MWLLQIIWIIPIIGIIFKHKPCTGMIAYTKITQHCLNVTCHMKLPYLGMTMEFHVIFLSICLLVQKSLLYVGFLHQIRGFKDCFCDGDDNCWHVGSGICPSNNCTWNTHVPWIPWICLCICITRHPTQVSSSRTIAIVVHSDLFFTTTNACGEPTQNMSKCIKNMAFV